MLASRHVARVAVRNAWTFNRAASTLVLGEHADGVLSPGFFAAVTAAKALNQPIHAVVLGNNVDSVAKAMASVDAVKSVTVLQHEALTNLEAERVAPTLAKHLQSKGDEFTHVVAASSSFAKNIIPRFAALLDVLPITDVIEIKSADTFVRPIYAGNALSTVKSSDKLKILTVRTTSFAAAQQGDSAANVEHVAVAEVEGTQHSKWISTSAAKADRPDLATAKTVVSGGRALKSSENFKIIYDLADKLNAGVGASRAAVDAGYVPNSLQVGQTGKVVAPKLYIAVGISGAIQHVAGMKDSKCIVAINKDAEAPIFQIADYGLVADLFKAVPEMTEKL